MLISGLLRCVEQMWELTTSNDWPATLCYANQTFDQHFHFDNRSQATIVKAKVLVNSHISQGKSKLCATKVII